MNYHYATIADVWDACRGPLSKAGLCIIQMPGEVKEYQVQLKSILGHASGEFVACTITMQCVREVKGSGFKDADDPQAIGSALTYAKKYSLMSLVGVAADEDDDGATASAQPHQQQAAPRNAFPAQATASTPAPAKAAHQPAKDQQGLTDPLRATIKNATQEKLLRIFNITLDRDYPKDTRYEILQYLCSQRVIEPAVMKQMLDTLAAKADEKMNPDEASDVIKLLDDAMMAAADDGKDKAEE